MIIFADGIEVWCNGSTTDFGSVCPGSNPGTSTEKAAIRLLFLLRYRPAWAGRYLLSPCTPRGRGKVFPRRASRSPFYLPQCQTKRPAPSPLFMSRREDNVSTLTSSSRTVSRPFRPSFAREDNVSTPTSSSRTVSQPFRPSFAREDNVSTLTSSSRTVSRPLRPFPAREDNVSTPTLSSRIGRLLKMSL